MFKRKKSTASRGRMVALDSTAMVFFTIGLATGILLYHLIMKIPTRVL